MVVASDVFPLVHALLIGAGLKKSAAALAKEAKLQPKTFKTKHDLLDVYTFYLTHSTKSRTTTKVPVMSTTDVAPRPKKTKRERSSDRDSIGTSKDEPTSTKGRKKSSSDRAQSVKKAGTKKHKVAASRQELSSSDSKRASKEGQSVSSKRATEIKDLLSSDDSSESDEASDKGRRRNPCKKTTARFSPQKTKDETSDSSSSNDLSSKETIKRKTEAIAAQKVIAKQPQDAESSSDDCSSSDGSSSDSSDSDSDSPKDEEALELEAARRQEAARAALAWQPKKIDTVVTQDKAAGTPFQRVDGAYWSQKIVNDTLRDNSYEGTFGMDGVGGKANSKLLKTRGKDFTKGKNKFKRSTYMCGAISMASNSFKFET